LKANQKVRLFYLMAVKILFVCLGNICRSPLAEGILLHLVKERQLNLVVDSAGTANYHVGEAPDHRTIKNALKHGVDLRELRARCFSKDDFEKFDFIFAMDENNLKNILSLAKSDADKNKVRLFLDWANEKKGQAVPDPYYGTEKDFEEVFQLVNNACKNLLNKLQA